MTTLLFLFISMAAISAALEPGRVTAGSDLPATERHAGKAILLNIGHTFDGSGLAIGSPYPRYSVDVTANGLVVFRGYSNVRTERGEHTLSKSEFKSLIEAVRAFVRSGVRSANTFGYADIDFALDGKTGRIYFDRTNFREYLALRQALEKYLRTKSYRCPLPDPVRSIGGDRKLDICAKLVEFEDLI
jgi:hypothetical protein